jgi:uncharacterized membrane protein
MIVHFPIVLLIVSFLAYAAWVIWNKGFFHSAFRWSLTLGVLAAAAAVGTGLIAEDNAAHSDAAHAILTSYHKPLALTVSGLAIVLLIWALASKWSFKGILKYLYLVVFAATIGLLAATGHFGATLVYEHGMGVNKDVLKPLEHQHGDGAGDNHHLDGGMHDEDEMPMHDSEHHMMDEEEMHHDGQEHHHEDGEEESGSQDELQHDHSGHEH